MSAKHTPGPWAFSRSDNFGDARFYVAQQDGAPYTPNYSDVATLIAETVSGERVSIQEANARLIAAAPELLEALRAVDVLFGHLARDSTQRIWLDNARAAIAKAEGREA